MSAANGLNLMSVTYKVQDTRTSRTLIPLISSCSKSAGSRT